MKCQETTKVYFHIISNNLGDKTNKNDFEFKNEEYLRNIVQNEKEDMKFTMRSKKMSLIDENNSLLLTGTPNGAKRSIIYLFNIIIV